jgi:hypothetical protein
VTQLALDGFAPPGYDTFERRWRAAPAPRGVVDALVVRVGKGKHEIRTRVDVTLAGVAGERRDPLAQLSLIERRTVVALLGEDTARWHIPGDNVVADLDLSRVSPGTRLLLGTVIIEITAKPHAGCSKFRARLGDEALRWVNHRAHRARRLRGVFARIVRAGTFAVGDAISVHALDARGLDAVEAELP